ncbi:hypothetical protein CVIRNUC_002380 [Coccomyxa viridis]|uniref:Uncharacterized protein n=1 Tax=Coccomyxa viridis TaxID=1274662 RepID=A0AAV1HW15_9CHLO|nr:hypothetical protein CVIRNUC_002380 [Coccomyxa viridis]
MPGILPVMSKTKKLSEFLHKDERYKAGDCILVRGEGEKQPFVGRIRDIRAVGKHGQIQVQVAWFYRPEEAMGGRKAFHGQKELFKSEHYDWCFASTIESKCRVHSLHTYQALQHVGAGDFFARFTYRPATMEFRPDRVPVYCVCELPYNPDAFMIMCSKCEEWYHPKCIELTKTQCEKMTNFECPECKLAHTSNKRPRLD